MNAISLGWNCNAAIWGVSNGLRARKGDGYKTMPFDEMITNYRGLQKCLREDFKHFTDSRYLKLMRCPWNVGGLKRGEYLLVNTRYQFIFNHESPDHANLWEIQGWEGGQDHFVNNDYFYFKQRYDRRIENFRNAVKEGCNPTFLVCYPEECNFNFASTCRVPCDDLEYLRHLALMEMIC